jgi:hypothetical protein
MSVSKRGGKVGRMNGRRKTDAVHHPAHYGGDGTYEAIKVIEAWELVDEAKLNAYWEKVRTR